MDQGADVASNSCWFLITLHSSVQPEPEVFSSELMQEWLLKDLSVYETGEKHSCYLFSDLGYCHAPQTEDSNLLLAWVRCLHQRHASKPVQEVRQVRMAPFTHMHRDWEYKIHIKSECTGTLVFREWLLRLLVSSQVINRKAADVVISHSWSIRSRRTGKFPLRTECRRFSNGSVYLKNKGKSGKSLLQECVVLQVVMAAVVVSDLTFTPCTWRNQTPLDIATGRRAVRSDILLILLLRKASGQERQSSHCCAFRWSRLWKELTKF